MTEIDGITPDGYIRLSSYDALQSLLGEVAEAHQKAEAEIARLLVEIEEDAGALRVWRRRCAEADAEIERLRAALPEAYLQGFMASGQGYNGEYPFTDLQQSPLDEPAWVAERDQVVAAILGKP